MLTTVTHLCLARLRSATEWARNRISSPVAQSGNAGRTSSAPAQIERIFCQHQEPKEGDSLESGYTCSRRQYLRGDRQRRVDIRQGAAPWLIPPKAQSCMCVIIETCRFKSALCKGWRFQNSLVYWQVAIDKTMVKTL
jgi:hypothetical protein